MLKVAESKKTCEALQAQWEGIDSEGRPVHIRYRWGLLWVGPVERGAYTGTAVNVKEVFAKERGKPSDESMCYGELKAATAGVTEFQPPEEAERPGQRGAKNALIGSGFR